MIDTRQRLSAATRECIGERGLAATTSREIATRAGANLAAITYHFGSKDQLVAEALLETLRDWLAPALAVLTGGDDPRTRTLDAIRTLVTTFDRHRAGAPVFLQAIVEAPRIETLRAGLTALWDELRQLLAGQVAEMKQHDELAPWVDPLSMASLLIAVANGLVLQVTVDSDAPSLEAMAGQFASLLLAARGEA